MTATAFYLLARIAGGFRLSLSVHIRKTQGLPERLALRFKINLVVGWHYQYRVGNTCLFEQEGHRVNRVL